MSERVNRRNTCWFFFDALKEIAEVRRFPSYLTRADHRTLRRNGLVDYDRPGLHLGVAVKLTPEARELMAELPNGGK